MIVGDGLIICFLFVFGWNVFGRYVRGEFDVRVVDEDEAREIVVFSFGYLYEFLCYF